MYTSALVFALVGLTPAADATMSWQTDYAQARKQSASQKKPLAVILGSGPKGWQQLGRDGLTAEARQMLADRFVCLYVNTDTENGQRLARVFEMTGAQGIVISDRTGDVQAFRHEGDLANSDLVRNLTRFSDPEFVVVTTETNVQTRTSFYGPGNPNAAGANPFAPACRNCGR